MKLELKGQIVHQSRTRACRSRMEDLEATLGTPSAAETARVAIFFGAVANRDLSIMDAIGVNMAKTLMAGHELEWNRPFEPDEDVDITVTLDDVFDKDGKRFSILKAVYATPDGEEIQTQRSTFLMFL